MGLLGLFSDLIKNMKNNKTVARSIDPTRSKCPIYKNEKRDVKKRGKGRKVREILEGIVCSGREVQWKEYPCITKLTVPKKEID